MVEDRGGDQPQAETCNENATTAQARFFDSRQLRPPFVDHVRHECFMTTTQARIAAGRRPGPDRASVNCGIGERRGRDFEMFQDPFPRNSLGEIRLTIRKRAGAHVIQIELLEAEINNGLPRHRVQAVDSKQTRNRHVHVRGG